MATQTVIDASVIDIQSELDRLAVLAKRAIQESIKALVERDAALARQVSAADSLLNRLRYNIEERTYAVLAAQQLTEADLRTLIGAINVATNLERIGDHAAGIAHLALTMSKDDWRQLPADVPSTIGEMTEVVVEMVECAVEAFLTRNDLLAERIVRRDREIEAFQEQIYAMLVDAEEDRTSASPNPRTYLLWVSRNLERIGDRAANICERTIYVATGELKEFR
jgi:phosphate transport system protein